MTTNVLLRDLDVGMHNVADGRRLEVVADGLPLFGGAQLAIDTTLVCALRRGGNPTHNAANEDGAALRRARQRKVRTYPDTHAPSWWSSPWKWVGGGLRRFVPSSPNSPKHVPEARTNCSANGWSRHGAFDGALCWLAQLPEQWQRACWNSRAPVALMAQPLRLMRLSSTFAVQGWRCDSGFMF